MQTAINEATGETAVLVGDQWQKATQVSQNPKGEKAYLVGDKWLSDSPVVKIGSPADPDFKQKFVDELNGTQAPKPQATPSIFDKLLGAGEAGLSAATGIPASIAGAAAGAYRSLTGGAYGTPEGVQQGQQRAQEVSSGLTYQPRTETGQEYLRNVGDVIDKTKLAGIGPTEAMAVAGTAGPVLRQAENAAAPAVRAIANSPEVDALKSGAASVARTVLPTPKPEVAALARKALALDIPLRPDMLTDNKFARMIGEAFEKIPLAGSRAEARQVAFNRALVSQIGGDHNATRLTPDVFRNAMETSGEKIGEIARKTPIRLTDDATAILEAHAAQADKYLPSDIAKVVKNYVSDLNAKADRSSFERASTQLAKAEEEVMRIRASQQAAVQETGRLSAETNTYNLQSNKYTPVEGQPRIPGRYSEYPERAAESSAAKNEVAGLAKKRAEELRVAEQNVARLQSIVSSGEAPTISGDTFRKINTAIGRQVRTSQNGDLRSALSELQADMHELLKENIRNPADLEALQTARQHYAIGTTLIPLVAKAPVGNISPAALMQAVTNSSVKKGFMAKGGGEMGDLARIGQLFLKEPPSSGTAERGLIYGGALGGSAVINVPAAAGVFGAANVYNRAGPALTRGLLGLKQ